MKKKFLVTGASGFIASHVADLLTNQGKRVILLDRVKSPYKKIKQKMIVGDINNFRTLNLATKKVDTIFHFAATADINEADNKPFEAIENNILGTVKLLKACLKNKVKKIIFASSVYAISENGGIYSTTKLASEIIIERLCKKYNFKYVILRFGTVYGERANSFNTIKNFVDNAKKKLKIFRETKGDGVRKYIHVKDVAKLVLNLSKKTYENGHYNIFGNKKINVKSLLNIFKREMPNLKVKYSKYDKKNFNYKTNPFSFKLRIGKEIKLKKYISLQDGIANLLKK